MSRLCVGVTVCSNCVSTELSFKGRMLRARPFRCAAPSRLICHSRRLQLIVPAAAVVVVGGAVRALSVWALCVKRLACVALRILSCLLGKYYVLRYLDIFSERTVKPRNRVVQQYHGKEYVGLIIHVPRGLSLKQVLQI